MKAVVDRIVQYANRYQLTNVETGEVLGTFDFEEVTGTVQQVGTEIDKELFDSIANDLAARVKLSGGELAETIVTFPDISDTATNVASGDTSATLWGKVKNWFSRLKALAFKNKVAAGDFEAGAIKNADVAADAAIAQSKVSGLMTDYVASISVSGRALTFKNKSGATMGTATTQDTTYGLASQSSNGLMSATDKTKLDGINEVLNNKANTSGSYPNLTVGKATNADNATNATKATQDADGNVINETYAKLAQVVRKDAYVGVISPISDAGKNWLANKQVMTSAKVVNASGWYRIAKIPQYCECKLSIFKQFNYDAATATTITINSGIANYNYVLINVENTLAGDTSNNYVKQVRFSNDTANVSGYVDVYIEAPGANSYWLGVDVQLVYENNFEVFAFESVTEAVADNAIIVDVPKNGGSNTNKPIYQQGKPVLVGDQSAIFESDGTTVKKATNAENTQKVNNKNLYCHELKFTLADGLGAGYKGKTFVFYGQILSSSNKQVENSIKLYSLVQASGVSRIKVEGLYDETIENGGFYRNYVNGAITAQSTDSIKFIGLATSYSNSSSSNIYPIAEIDVGSMTIEDIVTQIL